MGTRLGLEPALETITVWCPSLSPGPLLPRCGSGLCWKEQAPGAGGSFSPTQALRYSLQPAKVEKLAALGGSIPPPQNQGTVTQPISSKLC